MSLNSFVKYSGYRYFTNEFNEIDIGVIGKNKKPIDGIKFLSYYQSTNPFNFANGSW